MFEDDASPAEEDAPLEIAPDPGDANAGGADGEDRMGTGPAFADASARRIASTLDGMT